jgi:transcriptional regulator with XRE-family HTH domain
MKKRDLQQAIAYNVRVRMKALRIKQDGLARKAGMGQTTMSRILRGEANPQLLSLERIATALGLTIEELLQPPPAPTKAINEDR